MDSETIFLVVVVDIQVGCFHSSFFIRKLLTSLHIRQPKKVVTAKTTTFQCDHNISRRFTPHYSLLFCVDFVCADGEGLVSV